MKRFTLILLFALVGCQNDGKGPTPPVSAVELKGNWLVTEVKGRGIVDGRVDQNGMINISKDNQPFKIKFVLEVSDKDLKVTKYYRAGDKYDLNLDYQFSNNTITTDFQYYDVKFEGSVSRLDATHLEIKMPNGLDATVKKLSDQEFALYSKELTLKQAGREEFNYKISGRGSDGMPFGFESGMGSSRDNIHGKAECSLGTDNKLRIHWVDDEKNPADSAEIETESLSYSSKMVDSNKRIARSLSFKSKNTIENKDLRFETHDDGRTECVIVYTNEKEIISGDFVCQWIAGTIDGKKAESEVAGDFKCSP